MSVTKKMIAILATACAVLASCSKDALNTWPSDTYRQVSVLAVPADTFADVFAWSESDRLTVARKNVGDGYMELSLTAGAGTPAATFCGQIPLSVTDDTALCGWSGGEWKYTSGSFSVFMAEIWTGSAGVLTKNTYPLIGEGTPCEGIALRPVMGLLHLTVKGEDANFIRSVTVTSKKNPLAGTFSVTPYSDSCSVTGGKAKTVTIELAEPCTGPYPYGVDVYVPIPPSEYASRDLTVTVTRMDDTSFENTFSGSIKIAPGSVISRNVQELPASTGTAKRTGDIDVKWVQLWEGGPRWAVYNVGASKSSEFGGHYAWGGTENKSHTDPAPPSFKESIQYDADYDTARRLWGDNWQMPTHKDFEALVSKCTYTETTVDGIPGKRFTGKDDFEKNSIFLPAAGSSTNGMAVQPKTYGHYWTATPRDTWAYWFRFSQGEPEGRIGVSSNLRSHCYSVRAILKQ